MGVSYKPGVADLRGSPALKIMQLLGDRGADLAYHDPHVPELSEFALCSEDLRQGLADADLAVIVTAHPDLDHGLVARTAPLAVDLRGVTRGLELDSVVRL